MSTQTDKLIKQGIQYSDQIFEVIKKRVIKDLEKSNNDLQEFLSRTKEYTIENPLVTTGYVETMTGIVVNGINQSNVLRGKQRELVRTAIQDACASLIVSVGEDLKQQVRDIVKNGYDQGLSNEQISKELTKNIDSINRRRARVIARTETSRAESISDYIVHNERGAIGFTVKCRPDCCPICAEDYADLSGDAYIEFQESNSSGRLIGGERVFSMSNTDMLPPRHPNCRCSAEYVYSDEEEIRSAVSSKRPTVNSEQIEDGINPSIPSMPNNVKSNLNKFAEKTATADREYLTVTASDGTVGPISSGRATGVKVSQEQIKWMEEKRKQGLDIYASHNHPNLARFKQYDNLTMLSEDDYEYFLKGEHWGDNHVKSYSAEGPKNRVTITDTVDLDKLSFKEKYNLNSERHTALNHAYDYQLEFERNVVKGVPPSIKFMREKKQELEKQGIDWRSDESVLKPYEKQAKKLDETYQEDALNKCLDNMNSVLDPVGLHISSEVRRLDAFKNKYQY